MLLSGLTPELLRPAGWVFLISVLIVSRHLPLRWALPVVALKVSIPLFYFAADAGGRLHLEDDLAYFYGVLPLHQMGFDPVSIFTDPRGLPLLMGAASSNQHIVYHLWNLVGVWVFGPHYFSAVFLNVGLTCASGWFFYRLVRETGFPRDYGRLALAFFLLHWDTIVWSSFLNLKDTLVVTLSLGLLYQFFRMGRGEGAWRLVPAAGCFAGLLYLRWYAALLIPIAMLINLYFSEKRSRTALHALLVLGLLSAAFLWTPPFARLGQIVRPETIPWGLPQFLLTPLPWKLSAEYGFLLIPAMLHLALIGPALLMAPVLWPQHPAARLLLIYAAIVVVAFAAVPEFRGIRQRQMISFALIWLQFHALWMLARYAVGAVGGAPDLARSRESGRSGLPATHGDATAQPQASQ